MVLAPAVLVCLGLGLAQGRPSASAQAPQLQTTGFSSFDPNTGTYTVGTNTNLYQESHSGNPDDFLLGFENLFPGSGSISDGAAFNPFATADGECDEFCQKVFALDTQSQAQFEQDFLSFQAQFGGNTVAGAGEAGTSQQQPPRTQTQVAGGFPNNNNNNNNQRTGGPLSINNNNVNRRPDDSLNNNVQDRNYLFINNNNNNNRPSTPSTPSTTPFTVFTTTTTPRTPRPTPRPTRAPQPRPTPPPPQEEPRTPVTARAPVTIPVQEKEATTARPQAGGSNGKKPTKIKWTYNGKTIGTSTITEKPQSSSAGDSRNSRDGEILPISSYFNEIDGGGGRQEPSVRGTAAKDNSDFPVFDAVPN